MQQSLTKGYLFEKSFRMNIKLFAGGTALILCFFVGLMWYDLLFLDNYSKAKALIIEVVSICIFGMLLMGYKNYRHVFTKYELNSKNISNLRKNKRYVVSLEEDIFVSKVSVTFFLGKGAISKDFLIIASKPTSLATLSFIGTKAIEHVHKNGAVLLPYDNNSILWYKEKIKSQTVPSYPSVAYTSASITKKPFF